MTTPENRDLTDQLDLVGTELRLEIGRLRGEMLVLRETVTSIDERLAELTELVERSARRSERKLDQTVRALTAAPPDAPGSSVRRTLGKVKRRVQAQAGREAPTAD